MTKPTLLLFLSGILMAADTTFLDRVERRVFELTLKQRKGLPRLAPDPTLSQVARAHSRDMYQKSYFDHVNPEGLHPQDRVAKGHRQLIGLASENLWMAYNGVDDPDRVARRAVDAWMKSEGHRRNLLSESPTHMGIGVWTDGQTIYITQLFAEISGYISNVIPVRMPNRGLLLPEVRSLGSNIDYFDLEPVGGGASTPRASLEKGLALDGVSPGEYRLRFWFRNGDRGWILMPGPAATIRPASALSAALAIQ